MRVFSRSRVKSSAHNVRGSSVAPVRTLMLKPMYEKLLEELNATAVDETVRCVVLTGGTGAFSGRSESWASDEAKQDSAETRVAGCSTNTAELLQLMERLSSMPVPLIAAVRGRVSGVGMSIALNCDIVIAAKSATFNQPFGRVGISSGTGAAWLLPRLIGRARAVGWTLLGETLTAEDAVRIGLIWACYPGKGLEIVVDSAARRLAAISAGAATATRKTIDLAPTLSLRAAIIAEANIQDELAS